MNFNQVSLSSLWITIFGLSLLYGSHASLDLSNLDVNDIKNQLPGDFPKTNISVDTAKDLIKDKCSAVLGKDKGQEAYQELEIGAVSLVECITNLLNYTTIQEEIEAASPKGELDTVFNKYCAKQPDVVACIDAFSAKIIPCLDKEEQDTYTVFMRMGHNILDFVCSKGGDHIALFIAEKGPECIQSHKDDIQNCLNTTFSSYVPTDGLENIKSLPKLVLTKEQCTDIYHLETCIVQKLETCEEITPANIVESMFRFMRNETICRDSSRPQSLTSASAVNGIHSANNPSTIIFFIFLQIGVFFYYKTLGKKLTQ